jgi:hypothetical protein
VAPQTKAPPQATSAVVLSTSWPRAIGFPPDGGRRVLGTELAKLRANLSVRPAYLGRSRPPGASARFGEAAHPAQRRHLLSLSILGLGQPFSSETVRTMTAAFCGSRILERAAALSMHRKHHALVNANRRGACHE